MKTKGMVKAVSQKEKGFGIMLEEEGKDTWFNGFGRCPVQRFEYAEFEWEWNDEIEPRYRNIQRDSLKKIEKAEEMMPNAAKMNEGDRIIATKFINGCMEDAFSIYKNKSEEERGYLNFNDLLDVMVRVRITLYLNR